jgi:hypothetical protein
LKDELDEGNLVGGGERTEDPTKQFIYKLREKIIPRGILEGIDQERSSKIFGGMGPPLETK